MTKPSSNSKGRWRALSGWFDTRLGLANTILRPVPTYSLRLDYWLGALAFVAFLICGVTGILQLQYYVPTPAAAYDSVQHINGFIPYGNLIQSVHLYSAFAMIFFAFAHMMRRIFSECPKEAERIDVDHRDVDGAVCVRHGLHRLPSAVDSPLKERNRHLHRVRERTAP